MRTKYLLFFITVVFIQCGTGQTQKKNQTAKRPNIIIINVDDMGWADVGYVGNTFYETPNIDKLAGAGMAFTNGYAAASNCAPSRACLMTGKYTPRHGIYTVGSSKRGKAFERKLIPTPNTTTLADSMYTIAEELRSAGYVTASVGKWHLGEDPLTQGFDVNIGGNHKGHPKSYFSPYGNEDLPDGPEGENLTDRLTNEAIQFIEKKKDSAFFLYLPYYAVHTPLQGKEELIEKYKQKNGENGNWEPVYASMIDVMDQNVGKIQNTIKQLGLTENTFLIFTSDNGAHNVISDQKPLRAGKGAYYEGGIREPLVIVWPGKIRAGSKCDVPVTNIDFYPTILEVAGIKQPLTGNLDGQSLLPLLFEKEGFNEDRALFWHFPIYLQAYDLNDTENRDVLFRTRPGSVVRKGKWKLHEYFEDGGLELYNLEEDLGEENNLAEKNRKKAEELKGILNEWRSKTNAPVPTELNPKYNPEKERK